MRKILKKFFRWIFKEEYAEFEDNLNYIKEIVGDKTASCNVDVHLRTPSWAVINLRGNKRTYLKFIRLEDKDCKDIFEHLKQFAYSDIDAPPSVTPFMKAEMEYYD